MSLNKLKISIFLGCISFFSCSTEQTATFNNLIKSLEATQKMFVVPPLTNDTKSYLKTNETIKEIQVLISQNELKMTVSTMYNLTAMVKYPDGLIDSSVTWESSDTNIAKINEEGQVNALRKGEVEIKAVSKKDKNKFSICKVQIDSFSESKPVKVEITNLSGVNKLERNERVQLSAKVRYESGNFSTKVKWKSSYEDIAEVKENGVVIFKQVSSAPVTITATSIEKDSIFSHINFTVQDTRGNDKIISVYQPYLNNDDKDKDKKKDEEVKHSCKQLPLTFQSSASKYFFGKNTSSNRDKDIYSTLENNDLNVCSFIDLSSFYYNEDGTISSNLTYSSSDNSIAIIESKSGRLLPLKEGNVTITINSKSKSKNLKFNIKKNSNSKPESLKISNILNKSRFFVGERLELVGYVKFDLGYISSEDIQWTSSDSSLAEVSDGIVTFYKEGNVIIKASLKDNDSIKDEISLSSSFNSNPTFELLENYPDIKNLVKSNPILSNSKYIDEVQACLVDLNFDFNYELILFYPKQNFYSIIEGQLNDENTNYKVLGMIENSNTFKILNSINNNYFDLSIGDKKYIYDNKIYVKG